MSLHPQVISIWAQVVIYGLNYQYDDTVNQHHLLLTWLIEMWHAQWHECRTKLINGQWGLYNDRSLTKIMHAVRQIISHRVYMTRSLILPCSLIVMFTLMYMMYLSGLSSRRVGASITRDMQIVINAAVLHLAFHYNRAIHYECVSLWLL